MTSRVSTANLDAFTSFNTKCKHGPPLRRGKWTLEEEAYISALIDEFKQGYLPLKEGMSLRSFLAKMVRCNHQGKRIFENSTTALDPREAHVRRAKLQDLENKFEESVKTLTEGEVSWNSRMESSLVMSADSVNPYPSNLTHRRSLLGCNLGLTGTSFVARAESSWLQGATASHGGINLPEGTCRSTAALERDLGSLNPMATSFDLALLHGIKGGLEPSSVPASIEYGGNLGDMVRSKDNQPIGMDHHSVVTGDLFENFVSDASLGITSPEGLAMASLLSESGIPSGRRRPSVAFPSLPGFPFNLASHGNVLAEPRVIQDILHQQLGAASYEMQTRRQRINLVTKPYAQVEQRKRPHLRLDAPNSGAFSNEANKRRLC